jgi:hypothetical protein
MGFFKEQEKVKQIVTIQKDKDYLVSELKKQLLEDFFSYYKDSHIVR